MSAPDTGGTAFPMPGAHLPSGKWMRGERGMSLRDYFAAKALQGFAAHLNGATKRGNETGPEANARLAYEYADAIHLSAGRG